MLHGMKWIGILQMYLVYIDAGRKNLNVKSAPFMGENDTTWNKMTSVLYIFSVYSDHSNSITTCSINQ